MKSTKILLPLIAILMMLIATPASSQVASVNLVSQYKLTVDTVTNTGTKYLELPASFSGRSYSKTAFITFKADKISGTVGGTAQLEVSANGTDYAPVGTAFTLTDVATQVTPLLTVSTGWYGYKARIKVTGTGTMSAKIYGAAVFKN
mgnify:CR=1 FL=1